MNKLQILKEFWIPSVVLAGIIVYLVLKLTGFSEVGVVVILLTIALGSYKLVWETFCELVKGNFVLDYIALVAIIVGLMTGEFLVAAIIALMIASGRNLEQYGFKRAKDALTKLVDRIPDEVTIWENNELGRKIKLSQVQINQLVVIRKGEVVGLDGELISENGLIDESSFTGEPYESEKFSGDQIRSGTINIGDLMVIKVTKTQADSTYNKIITMVKDAQTEKAPLVRLADKYSTIFTILTAILSIGTYIYTQDLYRVLAILVVATPCPLLLATPIASLGGMRSTATWLHPDKVRNVEGVWYYNGRKVEGDLLHIPGLSAPGSVLGVSPLTMCRQAITAGADAERFMSTWLSNRARPSMVFRNTEKALPSADAAVIKERVSSTVQSGEPFVIGKDWEVTMLGLSADDAGFVQSARLSATQVATVFGIPPQMIGGDAGSSLTYSTVELNQIQFLTNTLRPWITRLEEGFSSLLPRPHYVKFNVDAMLRVDTKTRHEVFQIDRNIGLKSIDELRALEDEQPLPDGQGADYTPLGQMGAARAKEAR
jgi:hypothetical protein